MGIKVKEGERMIQIVFRSAVIPDESKRSLIWRACRPHVFQKCSETRIRSTFLMAVLGDYACAGAMKDVADFTGLLLMRRQHAKAPSSNRQFDVELSDKKRPGT